MSAKTITRLFALAALAAGPGCSQLGYRREPFMSGGQEADKALAAAVSEFNRAVDMVDASQYAQAEGEFAENLPAFEELGSIGYASRSRFWLGYCKERQQRIEDARREYDKLIETYPSTRAAKLARDRLNHLSAGPPPSSRLLRPAPRSK